MKNGNKRNDKALEDLLRRAREGRLEDDFERAAAEGFASLRDPAEAFDAKAATDKKVQRLFTAKKRTLVVYWAAAAGLLLVMTLTILLLRDDTSLDRGRRLGDASHRDTRAEFKPSPPSQPPSTEAAAEETTPETIKTVPPQKNKTRESIAANEPPAETELPARAEAEAAGLPAADKTTDLEQSQPAEPETTSPQPPAQMAEGNLSKANEDQLAGKSSRMKKVHRRTAEPAPESAGQVRSGAFFLSADGVRNCLLTELKNKLPEHLNKAFDATVTVGDGAIKSVRFPRRSGLSWSEEKSTDSLLVRLRPQCLQDGVEQNEMDVEIAYRP